MHRRSLTAGSPVIILQEVGERINHGNECKMFGYKRGKDNGRHGMEYLCDNHSKMNDFLTPRFLKYNISYL